MTARKVFRTWIKEPKPEPVNVRAQKARKLPMPGPGIVVTVRLHLLPEYLAPYALQPMTRGEAQDAVQRSNKPRLAGVLYVKRAPKETKS